MSLFTLAAESSVLGALGPTEPGAVDAGAAVYCLGRSGSLATAEVLASSREEMRPGVRLLTRCGEVLVPASTRLAGSRGPLVASAVKPGPRQLESLKPGQAPGAFPAPRPLEDLAGARMVIPTSEVARDVVEAALARAGVPFSARGNDEWVVIDVTDTGHRDGWTWDDEVRLLRLLTLWRDGESRTLAGKSNIRRRLLWAMIAAGWRYDARWVPAYRPVECRVTDIERVEVFSSVIRSEPVMVTCHVIEVEAAALIVDRTYVLPHV